MSSEFLHRNKGFRGLGVVRSWFAQKLTTYLTNSSLEKFDFF
jgi:hypothetical protein